MSRRPEDAGHGVARGSSVMCNDCAGSSTCESSRLAGDVQRRWRALLLLSPVEPLWKERSASWPNPILKVRHMNKEKKTGSKPAGHAVAQRAATAAEAEGHDTRYEWRASALWGAVERSEEVPELDASALWGTIQGDASITSGSLQV